MLLSLILTLLLTFRFAVAVNSVADKTCVCSVLFSEHDDLLEKKVPCEGYLDLTGKQCCKDWSIGALLYYMDDSGQPLLLQSQSFDAHVGRAVWQARSKTQKFCKR